MAAPSSYNVLYRVKFITKQAQFAVADTEFSIPSNLDLVQLNRFINSLIDPQSENALINFDILINGEFLRVSLEEHVQQENIPTDSVIELEYVERHPAPEEGETLEHPDWLMDVKASNDLILTGCYDHAARIWTTAGKLLVTITGHRWPVKCVAWINNDVNVPLKRFVTGGGDEMAYIWEWNQTTNKVECVNACPGHLTSVDAVAVSPDANTFATVSWDKLLKIWTTATSSEENGGDATEEEKPKKKKKKTEEKPIPTKLPLLTLSGHTDVGTSVLWMDNSTVCTSSMDQSIRLWDAHTGRLTNSVVGKKAFFDISYSSLSRLIVAGCADQYVRIYDPRATGGDTTVKSTYTSHSGWVVSVAWSPTHEHQFISGSYDSVLKLWDTRSPRAPLYDIMGHKDKVMCVDWSMPEYMMSGGQDSKLHIYKSTEKTAANNFKSLNN